jgi:hypothetical protein
VSVANSTNLARLLLLPDVFLPPCNVQQPARQWQAMSDQLQLLASVLKFSLEQLEAKPIPVFTFALYHDHESHAVSVCVDTEENSLRSVEQMNQFNMKHFMAAVAAGDLAKAGSWQANIGRSLSLGDFRNVNLARTKIEGNVDDNFYLSMVRTVIAHQDQIATLAPKPERLVFACSGPNDEVRYVWAYSRQPIMQS